MEDQEEVIKFSIDELYKIYKQIKQKVEELEYEPPRYVVLVRPDIYQMIEELAQAHGITWEQAWFKLLNNEFEETE